MLVFIILNRQKETESMHMNEKKARHTRFGCSMQRLASKYLGLTWIPCDGLGEFASDIGLEDVKPEDWLLIGENCKSASMERRTFDGKKPDHVPKRWRIAGYKLESTCL